MKLKRNILMLTMLSMFVSVMFLLGSCSTKFKAQGVWKAVSRTATIEGQAPETQMMDEGESMFYCFTDNLVYMAGFKGDDFIATGPIFVDTVDDYAMFTDILFTGAIVAFNVKDATITFKGEHKGKTATIRINFEKVKNPSVKDIKKAAVATANASKI